MITRFICGDTIIKTQNFRLVPAPGIGSIEFVPCESIWTGDVHIYPAFWKDNVKLSVHVGNISEIARRSSLNEDDEPWKVVFRRKKKFTYKSDKNLEKLIVRLSYYENN